MRIDAMDHEEYVLARVVGARLLGALVHTLEVGRLSDAVTQKITAHLQRSPCSSLGGVRCTHACDIEMLVVELQEALQCFRPAGQP